MTAPENERLKLIIGYDGRAFRGWQSQITKDAVQDHLEIALASILCKRVVVHGSGRTDTGVHALAQVAHIDVPRGRYRPDVWLLALNSKLPPQVRILRVTRARPDFHARFKAQGKTYHYRIWTGPVLPPLELGRAWHVPAKVDFALLQEAGRELQGEHDFAGFAASRGHPELSTVRTVHEIKATRRGCCITVRFTGTGFLYHMVRLLTGSMVRVAQGRDSMQWLRDLRDRVNPGKSNYTAPAEGLYLERVYY